MEIEFQQTREFQFSYYWVWLVDSELFELSRFDLKFSLWIDVNIDWYILKLDKLKSIVSINICESSLSRILWLSSIEAEKCMDKDLNFTNMVIGLQI